MNENVKVAVVVVTYNRKKLLLECLDAILAQTFKVSNIILIDNASTDGTEKELREKGLLNHDCMNYKRMEKNLGGAGGFYEGIRCTLQMECDWVWIMDDDTIPNIDALEKLLEANSLIIKDNLKCKVAFLASTVYGTDGEFMNLPVISMKNSGNGYAYWYKFLNQGIVSISNATFVSVLISKNAIDVCGLPCKDYFIWGDDTEYTERLTTFYGDGYFVGNSCVVHKRFGAQNLNLFKETNENRTKMYVYYYRNTLINKVYYSQTLNIVEGFLVEYIKSLFKYLSIKNIKYIKIMHKGYWSALFQFGKFKRYIDGQIKR